MGVQRISERIKDAVEKFKSENGNAKFKDSELTDYETEHIVPVFRNRLELKGDSIICNFPAGSGKLSLTVDTEEDYEKMKNIFERFYNEKNGIDLDRVIKYLLLYSKQGRSD